ncbi:MAG: hypothetical protein FJ128_13550 [Deltaproteobacteria bacterium]|nr:hypothetical protein [Deltaproteobacteria bacterium]
MTQPLVVRVPGGYKVDGLELCAADCDCGGRPGPGGGQCCCTFSRVKKEGGLISYFGKKTTPETTDNFEWGYQVRKAGTELEVEVKMLDTRSPTAFRFGGVAPPPLSAWQERGWQVFNQFERPIIGTGEPLPDWITAAGRNALGTALKPI